MFNIYLQHYEGMYFHCKFITLYKNSSCTNPILQIYYIPVYWILRDHPVFFCIDFNDLDIGTLCLSDMRCTVRTTLRLRHFTSRNLQKSPLSLVNFILIMSNKTSIPPEDYQRNKSLTSFWNHLPSLLTGCFLNTASKLVKAVFVKSPWLKKFVTFPLQICFNLMGME